MKVVCIIPTYGRGEKQMRECAESFLSTTGNYSTQLWFIREPDDEVSHVPFVDHSVYNIALANKSSGGLGQALNRGWQSLLDRGAIEEDDVLGCFGDDNRFRTPGWDDQVLNLFQQRKGFAYGPDGSDNVKIELPTWWFQSAEIAYELGWMALPECKHFFLDNAVAELGKGANCLYYMPECYIEHLHFSFGKSEKDATYDRTMQVGSGDHNRFANWRNSPRFEEDRDIVRSVVQLTSP